MTRYVIHSRTYKPNNGGYLTPPLCEIIDTEKDDLFMKAKNPKKIKKIYNDFWNPPESWEKVEILEVRVL